METRNICAVVFCGMDFRIDSLLRAINALHPFVVLDEERAKGRYQARLRFGEAVTIEKIETFIVHNYPEVQTGICDCSSSK